MAIAREAEGKAKSEGKTLEMRVAELEDKLAKLTLSEEQLKALRAAPCIAAGTTVLPYISSCAPCTIGHCIIHRCIISQCIIHTCLCPCGPGWPCQPCGPCIASSMMATPASQFGTLGGAGG
jgi:hypothetical protein